MCIIKGNKKVYDNNMIKNNNMKENRKFKNVLNYTVRKISNIKRNH